MAVLIALLAAVVVHRWRSATGPQRRAPTLVYATGGLGDRVAALDGRLEVVESHAGRGTAVRAVIPCQAAGIGSASA